MPEFIGGNEADESAVERSFFVLPEIRDVIEEKAEGKPLNVVLKEKIETEMELVDQMSEDERIAHYIGLGKAVREIRKDYKRRAVELEFALHNTNILLDPEIDQELQEIADRSEIPSGHLAEFLLVEVGYLNSRT